MRLIKSVKLDKSVNDWVIAMYCDYGKPETKRVIRLSYSEKSAQNSWRKYYKYFSKNKYRCWQENKKGEIINDSNVQFEGSL